MRSEGECLPYLPPQSLEQELSSMAEVLKDKQERIKLLEEEIKSHSSTTSVMKSDLGIW